jgi:hypothetical protein
MTGSLQRHFEIPAVRSAIDELPHSIPTFRASLSLAFCLFLAVWGTKLAIIDRFGTDLPFWDQWAKEGEFSLIPWFERGEFWRYIFLPHNEHRIAPTIALNLGLVAVGRQWDARVQCIVSAGLHGLIAALFFFWVLRRFNLSWALATGVLLLVVVAPPIAWENVVAGFQSQFYFLILFSGLAIGGLLNAPAFSWRWYGGFVAGAAALVSMGSGLLCAIPIAVIAGTRLLRGGSNWRAPFATLLAAIALSVAGVCLHTSTPWHEPLHARSAHDFLLFLVRCLSWPFPQFAPLAALLWAPWLALLAIRLREFHRADAARVDFVLAAGGWVLLQAAAVAYSRGAGAGIPSSRYGDISAPGLALSFCALGLLPLRTWQRTAIGTTFIAISISTLTFATREVWRHDLPARKEGYTAFEQSVRDFVITNQYASFEKAPLPFPDPAWLARILQHDSIRSILPASVHAPLPSGEPAPVSALSHGAARLAAHGAWLAGAGMAGAVALAIYLWQRQKA